MARDPYGGECVVFESDDTHEDNGTMTEPCANCGVPFIDHPEAPPPAGGEQA